MKYQSNSVITNFTSLSITVGYTHNNYIIMNIDVAKLSMLTPKVNMVVIYFYILSDL